MALGCADEWLRTVDDEYPYAVAFVAVVNPITRTIVYASAGHDCAFALGDDGRIAHLMATAPMLGIPLVINPCDAVFSLNPGTTCSCDLHMQRVFVILRGLGSRQAVVYKGQPAGCDRCVGR